MFFPNLGTILSKLTEEAVTSRRVLVYNLLDLQQKSTEKITEAEGNLRKCSHQKRGRGKRE
jgi:hypothetical protein